MHVASVFPHEGDDLSRYMRGREGLWGSNGTVLCKGKGGEEEEVSKPSSKAGLRSPGSAHPGSRWF